MGHLTSILLAPPSVPPAPFLLISPHHLALFHPFLQSISSTLPHSYDHYLPRAPEQTPINFRNKKIACHLSFRSSPLSQHVSHPSSHCSLEVMGTATLFFGRGGGAGGRRGWEMGFMRVRNIKCCSRVCLAGYLGMLGWVSFRTFPLLNESSRSFFVFLVEALFFFFFGFWGRVATW